MELGNIEFKPMRILDFDIENRPLAYLGMDFTSAEITAIAAGWSDEKSVTVWALGDVTLEEMLAGFVDLYNEADIVTGHYIRNHDLPIINGALMELGMPALGAKLTSCTKNDLLKSKGVSKSQENLSEMRELVAPKVQMNQPKWRAANRLTPEGIELTKKRVVGDIVQHKQLRAELVESGWLGLPKVWKP